MSRLEVEVGVMEMDHVMENEDGKGLGTPGRYGIGAGIAVVLLLVVLAGGGMMMGPGMMLGGPLLLVVLCVWLFRGGRLADFQSPEGSASGDRALDVLRERYARGELSDEQYDRMRRHLT